ncbi:MAG: hypothetical protein ACRDJN_01045 [Chloroflexota bacterium]
MSESWPDAAPWLAVGLLGAYHGINPAMGWLFAVALGLQQRSRGVVLRALIPIALGHEASVALVVLLVSGLQLVAAPDVLRPLGAIALIAFGLYKFIKPRSHPRWVGMRIGPWELALWSFLMSTAHGAGLMLFPILLGLPATAAGAATGGHTHESGAFHIHLLDGNFTGMAIAQDATAVMVHTAAMLLAMGLVAVLVYEKLGVAILRRAWVNFDAVWAVAVMLAGVFTLFT